MSNDSETQHLVKGSLLAKIGLSVRGIVVIAFTVTLCIMGACHMEIPERLFFLASGAVGYYFGQQHQKPTA